MRDFYLYVTFTREGFFTVHSGFTVPNYSVFIVEDRPWGYREDRLLW